MTHALIVLGDETIDREDAVGIRLVGHLHKRARIPQDKLLVLCGKEASQLPEKIATAEEKDGVLLVFYVGHGAPKALGPTNKLRIPYDKVARAVASRKAPTLIVNGACYSYALAEALESAGADPKKVGIITACGTDGFGHGYVHDDVIWSWKNRFPYKPRAHLTIDTRKYKVGETWAGKTWTVEDESTITLHLGNHVTTVVLQPEPDRPRRWGTLALDKLFFTQSARRRQRTRC